MARRRTRKTIRPEDALVLQVAGFMKREAPEVPFRFDQIDQIGLVNGKKNKMIHGVWNDGYPDMFICQTTKKYGGLYLELKATKTLEDTEHTRGQAEYHVILRKQGYKCMFCVGLEDCIKKIKKYLKL